MFDADRLLKQLLTGGAASSFAGGMAGGMAGQLLTTKRGRKMGKSALKYGGLAAIGALAYAAWQKSQAGAPPRTPGPSGAAPPPLPGAVASPEALELPPPPPRSAFLPDETAPARESLGRTLVRAMIASASADGSLDSDESKRVFEALDRLELSGEERTFVLQEIASPASIEELAAAAGTPEVAAEVYAAALLAVEVDSEAERRWLARLATALRLPPEVAADLHERLEAAG
jgi:uncharacterized membrane protein YebE (DUF533 family)